MPAITTLNAPTVDRANSLAPLRRRVAHSAEEVDALAECWRELDTAIANPLVHFDWIRTALWAFEDEVEPFVITICRGGKLRAVAPLIRRRVHGVRRLMLAGVKELHEPSDLASIEPAALRRLVASITHRGAPLVLERMPADSPALRLLQKSLSHWAVVMVRPQATCPYIALDESWLEPELHLNAGRRSDLRRARRRAEQLGELTTELHTPSLGELPELLDAALEVEANSWKGDSGTALLCDPHRAAFYRRYAEAACLNGSLRICFLRIGDRVAAMQVAVEQGGAFWLLKVGYDQRFANCSPGMLLMRNTIRYAVEAGLSSYEFLGKAETWTRVWTTTERSYVTLRSYPFGVRGMSALVADASVSLYRKWRARK